MIEVLDYISRLCQVMADRITLSSNGQTTTYLQELQQQPGGTHELAASTDTFSSEKLFSLSIEEEEDSQEEITSEVQHSLQVDRNDIADPMSHLNSPVDILEKLLDTIKVIVFADLFQVFTCLRPFS